MRTTIYRHRRTPKKLDVSENALMLAKQEKVNLHLIKGTGAKGKIILRDVEDFLVGLDIREEEE